MDNEPTVYEFTEEELSRPLDDSEMSPIAWMIVSSPEEEGIRIIPGKGDSVILRDKAEAEYFKACLDHCIQKVYKS